jgi:hypothetical protein
MGLAEYFCRPLLVWISPNMAISQAKPYVAAPGASLAGKPMGHSPSSSAPCAVPTRLSRIDQHIKDEPCAKQRALLGVFSSRFSSVSRGVRSAAPIFSCLPLDLLLVSDIVLSSTQVRVHTHDSSGPQAMNTCAHRLTIGVRFFKKIYIKTSD